MFPEILRDIKDIILMVLIPAIPFIVAIIGAIRHKKNKKAGGKTVPEQIKYQLNNGRVRKIEIKVNDLKNDVKHVQNDLTIIKKVLIKK